MLVDCQTVQVLPETIQLFPEVPQPTLPSQAMFQLRSVVVQVPVAFAWLNERNWPAVLVYSHQT